jgi:hypothetical protein
MTLIPGRRQSVRVHRAACVFRRRRLGRGRQERVRRHPARRLQGGQLDRHQVGVGDVADLGIPGINFMNFIPTNIYIH